MLCRWAGVVGRSCRMLQRRMLFAGADVASLAHAVAISTCFCWATRRPRNRNFSSSSKRLAVLYIASGRSLGVPSIVYRLREGRLAGRSRRSVCTRRAKARPPPVSQLQWSKTPPATSSTSKVHTHTHTHTHTRARAHARMHTRVRIHTSSHEVYLER